jgi:hypothetical protein
MHDVVDLHWLIRVVRNKVHAGALISGVSAKAKTDGEHDHEGSCMQTVLGESRDMAE